MDQINTILGDLGFSPGDSVIDSDLIGEIECAIGAVKTPPKGPKGGQNVALGPKGGQNVALGPKGGQNVALGPKAGAEGRAAANKRIQTAQSKLKASVNTVLSKASALQSKANSLSRKGGGAAAAGRFSRMADRLTRSGTALKNLANKDLSKKGIKPLSANKNLPSKKPIKLSPLPLKAVKGKNILGQILEELFGEEAYDPATSERDPQTVAEAEAYVKAAKENYDAAKQEEVAAGNEVKRIRESPEAGTGDNPAYDEAISTGMEAALARGDAGAMLAAGNELLAYLKDQKPSGGSGETVPGGGGSGETVPGGGSGGGSGEVPPGGGSSGETAPGGGGSGEVPPGTEMPPPGTEGWPPGTDEAPPHPYGYPYDGPPPLVDPYGGFIDPFAGLPSNMERAARGTGGGGGWDDFADNSGDPDSDVAATENVQDRSYAAAISSMRAQRGTPPEALPQFEGELADSGEFDADDSYVNEEVADDYAASADGEQAGSEEQAPAAQQAAPPGVVGSYLFGTNVLIGCVFE